MKLAGSRLFCLSYNFPGAKLRHSVVYIKTTLFELYSNGSTAFSVKDRLTNPTITGKYRQSKSFHLHPERKKKEISSASMTKKMLVVKLGDIGRWTAGSTD